MQGGSWWDNLKSHYSQHKRWYIAALLGLLGVLVILVTFLGGNNVATNQNTSAPGGTNITGTGAPNPLISNSELEQAENAFRQKYKQSKKKYPETPKYRFDYQVGPSLSEKNGSLLPFLNSVFAQTGCNLAAVPTTVTGYYLKNHYSASDAASLASKYSIATSITSSIPGADGITFDYYFSNPQNSAYFKLSEPSGTYQYHNGTVSKDNPDITQLAAQVIATKHLSDHNLNDKLKFLGASFVSTDPAFQAFIFSYIKNLGLNVVDTEAIKELPANASVCNVSPAKTMNYTDVVVGVKGDLGKIINQTRTITGTYSLVRSTIDDSVKEYKDNLLIAPIVVGGGTATTGTVVLDEAVLVYYDYGESYGQYSYIPVYLTAGKGPTGGRVYTIFPAVSETELSKTPLSPKDNQKNTLQLETFKPAPPKPPGKLCYGNQIDYTVKCSQGSTPVCNAFFPAPTKDGDPWGVCTEGCKAKGGAISVAAGEDPCTKFMESLGIPFKKGSSISPGGKGGGKSVSPGKFKGGDVACSVNGCPC